MDKETENGVIEYRKQETITESIHSNLAYMYNS